VTYIVTDALSAGDEVRQLQLLAQSEVEFSSSSHLTDILSGRTRQKSSPMTSPSRRSSVCA
jgi:hypothetical protein